jgi:MFS family permease
MSPSRPQGFIASFMFLATFSGATIGMAKIVTTLYALHLGASPLQLGVISAMESLGMVLLTLPAGFVIARFGARRVYFLASVGPLLLNLAIPLFANWIWLAVARLLIGLCIPFRIVAMNSAFLRQLRHIGRDKAGWYRGALTLGMGLLGPLLGNALSGGSFTLGFVVIGLCFGLMAVYSLGFWEQEDPVEPVAGLDGGILAQSRALLGHTEVAESCVIELLCGATGALFGTFVIVLAMEVAQLSQEHAVSLVMIQGVAAVLGLFGLGHLVQRAGRRSTYLASLTLVVAGLLLLGRGQGYAWLALGTVLLSLASALAHLVNMAQMGESSLDKSKLSGLFNLAGMFGGCAGALLGGVISHWIGTANLFLAWIPLVLLTALFCWLRHLRRGSTRVITVEG